MCINLLNKYFNILLAATTLEPLEVFKVGVEKSTPILSYTHTHTHTHRHPIIFIL